MDALSSPPSVQPVHMSKGILLLPYAIVPAVVLMVAIDMLFLDQRLKTLLPAAPMQLFWYGLLFGFPHIVASLFAYGDKNYRAHYKQDLKLLVPVSLVAALVLVFALPPLAAYLVYTVSTLIHTIGQQTGLSRAYMRVSNAPYSLWRWSSAVVACCLAVALAQIRDWTQPLLIVAVAALCVSSYFALRLMFEAGGGKKAIYLVATQIMIFVSFGCVLSGYTLFAVLIPQFVHDLTAYSIYTQHDRNHTQHSNANSVYAKLRISGKHVFWFLPFASIGLSLLLSLPELAVIALTLTFFHYLMEKRAWSRSSMHRQYLKFS
jgi:hypothetical protein